MYNNEAIIVNQSYNNATTITNHTQTVRVVRGFEKRTVDAWRAAGARPFPHSLAPTETALAALRKETV